MSDIITELEELNIGKIEKNVSLKKYTTYRVGGIAKCIIFPKNVKALVKLIKYLKTKKVKYKVLGNGSNVLFSDKDYEGVLIKLNDIDDIEFFGKNKIRVGAGVNLIKLSVLTAKHGLTGLEFAAGIPGTVGGSVFMNAGAYKSDMGYVVERVKVLTPDESIINLENKEMDFHYRTSFLKKHPDYVCLEVILKLQKGKKEAIEAVIQDRRQRRLSSQPLEYPSAGSVFRNPEGDFAGRLIEECGLKGKKHGGAMISDKHANFVVNYKDATAEDIKYLIELAHQKVLENYGIDLKIEQEFVNWE
ncbi:MAG: UDP-N-acetylmuramate dehydrogenase [Bacilli bacterium]|nr:UDP-N-acetylmuramate dehydrogenase [Bacilli bacterium]